MQRKQYQLDQSPLYKLTGKRRFLSVLCVEWDAVPELLEAVGYREKLDGKGRRLQIPVGWMAAVHRRIASIMSRIELPAYIYSKKGRSYADNARVHARGVPIVKTDIRQFYASVTRTMVRRMFFERFRCAGDVAERLADICCFQQAHLPTGSPLSGLVAFFVAQPMFDEIVALGTRHGCTATVYVDDIVISGVSANRQLLGEVRTIVSRHGLKTKEAKSKTFLPTTAARITGAIVVDGEVRLPNSRHLKVHTARVAMAAATPEDRRELLLKLRGREREAQHVLVAR